MGLLALVVICPEGELRAVDAYFFGASASTESGLNTYVLWPRAGPALRLAGLPDIFRTAST